jgi:hypothetical protein
VAKYSASNRSTEEPYEEVSCPIATILAGGKESFDFARSKLSVKTSTVRLDPEGVVSQPYNVAVTVHARDIIRRLEADSLPDVKRRHTCASIRRGLRDN